ncbi:MAG: DUF6177 family protein [Bifidobacteriaceae bacterium]|jgi:hypothetical protein|nr:DUF6177 family protein [Bifidobacteriaceae bacterium]
MSKQTLTSPRAELRRGLADWLTDRRPDGTAESDAPPGTVWYSAAQAAFFRQTWLAGLHPVIVSGEHTELSEPTRQALRFYRGGWAVRSAAGDLRNGLTGKRISSPSQATDQTRPTDISSLAMAYLTPARSDYAQLMICVTARHEVTGDAGDCAPGHYETGDAAGHGLAGAPLPGETIELMMAVLGAAAGAVLEPWSFGQAEPALRPWDAAEIAWLTRRDLASGLPHAAFMISGSPLLPASLTLVIQPGPGCVLEHITGLIGLGRLGEPSLGAKLAAVDPLMEALSGATSVTFALVMARAGNCALTRPPVLPSAPIPLSILLGDGLIKGLDIDPSRALEQFQASPALGGRGLMVPLDAAASGRLHLAEFFRAVDFDRANPGMGISPGQLLTLHQAART